MLAIDCAAPLGLDHGMPEWMHIGNGRDVIARHKELSSLVVVANTVSLYYS
jgi:hypothetical protein